MIDEIVILYLCGIMLLILEYFPHWFEKDKEKTMHKITINCLCGKQTEVDVHKEAVHKNFIDCQGCDRFYYVHYNSKTSSYEIDLIGEDK